MKTTKTDAQPGPLAGLADLTPRQQRRAWLACLWRARRNWQTWLGLALCGGLGGVGGHLGFTVGREAHLAALLLTAAAFGAAGGFVLAKTWLPQAQKHLERYLEQIQSAPRHPHGQC
jgi:hypothetical protein